MHEADLERERLAQFGFTDAWVEQGVVTLPVLDELCTRWAEGTDPHLEHYRYSAFQQFMRANRNLTPTQFDGLWDLGRSDLDENMGESMLIQLILRRDCPRALLEWGASSEYKALARKSQQRLVGRFVNTSEE